jgi:hypothetical protein
VTYFSLGTRAHTQSLGQSYTHLSPGGVPLLSGCDEVSKANPELALAAMSSLV